MEVCRSVMPLLPAWQKRELVRTYARCHRVAQKDKEVAGGGDDRECKALIALQLLRYVVRRMQRQS